MFLNSMRHGMFSGIFLGILVLGAAGLMLSDWGGFFRDGVGRANVAEINGKAISSVEFDRIVRRSLQGQNIQPSDAYKAGIVDRILQNEIMARLFARTAKDMGIIVDDQIVSAQIHKLLEPMAGPNGDKKFALNQILQAQGMREQELVNAMRDDIGTSILRQTIASEVYVPESMTAAFYDWNMEERSIQYVSVSPKAVDVKEPTKQELESFYDKIKTQYTIPETRDVTIGIFTPADMVAKKDITDQDVRDFYDDHKEDFATEEARVIEQAVLKSEEEANQVLNEAKESKDLKASVKKVTGKETAYSGENSFEKEGLASQVSDIVFSTEPGNFAGPVKTPLGWHVIQVKSKEPAGYRSFDTVKKQIREDLTHADSSDAAFAITNDIEDRLSGGEKLSDLKDEFKLEIINLKSLVNGASPEQLLKYSADQGKILQAAFSTAQDEASPLSEITNGKMFTVQVNNIMPARAKDLKDVEAEVKKIWTAQETRRKLLVYAMDLVEKLDSEKTTLEQVAKDLKSSVKSGKVVRGSNPPEGIEKENVAQIMSADRDKALALPGGDDIKIIVINKSVLIDKKPEATALSDIRKNLTLDIQDERLAAIINAAQARHPVNINTGLLERLYSESQPE